ncbi:MAG TPA: DUF3786 domain-containing protein, partial [Desulfobacteria bacterium]|nr:DUF3786 domain-containing protein [Desulfobacteria bacterium]
KYYTLSIWGEEYGIFPEASKITRLHDPTGKVTTSLGLFVVHYLLTCKEIPIRKEWISVKDILGGETFFRGPHKIPADLIEKKYGDDLQGFHEVSVQLGGTALDMADAAYCFRIAPRIPVAVLLWQGDDEFPAKAKMLFDRSIGDHLALDIIFALAVELCSRFADFSMD